MGYMGKLFKKMASKSKHDLARYVFNKIRQIHTDRQTRKFIEHNQNVWKDYTKSEQDGEILLELTDMQTTIIAQSYIANVLSNNHKAKIKAYLFGESRAISYKIRKIYNSFGAEVFYCTLNQVQLLELERLTKEVYSRLKTKKDVYNLTLSEVWFGDLLYDSHLITNNVPTVVINDHRFQDSLRNALYQYIYWRDYFETHNVKAINVVHACYISGIPMRIAIQRDIPAYMCHINGCYYLTKDRFWAPTDYYDYPRYFMELSEDERRSGIKAAKDRIELRFVGKVGVDMSYSTKSAYSNKRLARVLSKSDRVKVLIAAHCFFDSPNGLGVNLFTDFYEWLTFLGNISEKTDYDWYIKTHPDFLPGNSAIINEFIEKYPKLTLIPAETSQHQIIEEGINFGLTVYGTIGFEYAALGVPVITASLCNPHIAYNFNIHPKTVDEYERILLNLPEQKLDIALNDVYEYYFMAFINSCANWLFNDYNGFIDEIGGFAKQFSPVSYKKFLGEFSPEKHDRILSFLAKFIDSKEHCLRKKHMNS